MKKSSSLIFLIYILITGSLAQEPLSKQAILTKFSGTFKAGDTVEVIRKNRVYSQERREYSINYTLDLIKSRVDILKKKKK